MDNNNLYTITLTREDIARIQYYAAQMGGAEGSSSHIISQRFSDYYKAIDDFEYENNVNKAKLERAGIKKTW